MGQGRVGGNNSFPLIDGTINIQQPVFVGPRIPTNEFNNLTIWMKWTIQDQVDFIELFLACYPDNSFLFPNGYHIETQTPSIIEVRHELRQFDPVPTAITTEWQLNNNFPQVQLGLRAQPEPGADGSINLFDCRYTIGQY